MTSDKRTVSAESFVAILAVNVGNKKLTDAEFRKLVENTLPIVMFKDSREKEDCHVTDKIKGRILNLFRMLEFNKKVPAGRMCPYCGALHLFPRGGKEAPKPAHDPECVIDRIICDLTNKDDVVDHLTFVWAQEALEAIEYAGGTFYDKCCLVCEVQDGQQIKRHDADCELASVLHELMQITGKHCRHE